MWTKNLGEEKGKEDQKGSKPPTSLDGGLGGDAKEVHTPTWIVWGQLAKCSTPRIFS